MKLTLVSVTGSNRNLFYHDLKTAPVSIDLTTPLVMALEQMATLLSGRRTTIATVLYSRSPACLFTLRSHYLVIKIDTGLRIDDALDSTLLFHLDPPMVAGSIIDFESYILQTSDASPLLRRKLASALIQQLTDIGLSDLFLSYHRYTIDGITKLKRK
jgi:hypothetical protein